MDWRARLRHDFQSFAENGLPHPIEEYVHANYRLDLTSQYGGIEVKNPFGKASGQLSLAAHQVAKDAEAGLGFSVLKTLVAQNGVGSQSMGAWAIPESRMVVERIRGRRVAEEGWTVTWKGRGWSDSFARYLEFLRDAVRIGDAGGMLVVPSCTFHLPSDPGAAWRDDEYMFTISSLLDVWRDAGRSDAMPLEKDFSPTLAGSELASHRDTIFEWVDRVPSLMRRASGSRPMRIGMKIFNALFDDDVQTELVLRAATGGGATDYVVYGNRLFDPAKTFEGKTGVAYGGPDLSARNLEILRRVRARAVASGDKLVPISATGNIDSGARAAEYLSRGCATFQLHTFFQLPDDQYTMKRGTKVERGLHELLFNPERGFIAAVLRLRDHRGWSEELNVAQMAENCTAWTDVNGRPGV